MTIEFIITAPPTDEYIKKHLYSERWQAISSLINVLNGDQQNIDLNTEDILDNIESIDADSIAFFLIMDPLGVGMEFSVEQIEDILGELRTADSNNPFFLVISEAIPEINSITKRIIELADYIVFFNDKDYNATKDSFKADQKFLIINPPSSLEYDTTFVDDRQNNVLVNGDILYIDAVNKLCHMARILQENQPDMEILCNLEVPYRHDITALALLLKAIYPEIDVHINKKMSLDPNLSARELVAWFEEHDTYLLGTPKLPIELAFNKPAALQNVVSKCTYAYDPVHTDLSKPSSRINSLRASGLLVLAGDPVAAAHNILNYTQDHAGLQAALQQQTQEYDANYSNEKIFNTIMKCLSISAAVDEELPLREKYPDVNFNYSYDEDFFWHIICNKVTSLNLHLEDQQYGGLVLDNSKTAFIRNDTSFSITNPLLIGGQKAAIEVTINNFKQAISKGLTDKHIIIAPLFKKNLAHWCLALIHIINDKAKLTILETINNDASLSAKEIIQLALPEKIKIIESRTICSRTQKDGVSCGPLTIKHLFDVLLPDNDPEPKPASYLLSEIYALRDEHLKLLDDPILTERQKTNADPAAEPQKTHAGFDLFTAIKYWRALVAKLKDNITELNQLSTLCQKFMLSELPDAVDISSAKSDLKTWFWNNATTLDCVPLFETFFEYSKSAAGNNEPRWKDNSIDNLVILLKVVGMQYGQQNKFLRFSRDEHRDSSEDKESDTKQHSSLKPDLNMQ